MKIINKKILADMKQFVEKISGNVYFPPLPITALSNLIPIATLTLKRVTS